ncbi:aminopeptidase P family protein [Kaustia mangrovi]|uniref:Aminopeptidase P family protein n=1 Tax=Kaustia mangrovi TaxID=2593653 RepID=A0A7S8C1Y6_9HYPH|nr:aminopeptidase P family protein [Kaustia mangrovi]QPC41886.1 aminopeptidase P family protein [Kaustia mangrovi]
MFQTFEDAGETAQTGERLKALRAELERLGVDGFLVPRADEHQGEYVAAYAERLSWLTGFTGSAGLAVVLADRAAIFIDGRYTIQAREQVDTALFTPCHLIDEPPATWLKANLREGQTLSYDPWLHTSDQIARLAKACRAAGAALVALDSNPVDTVWTDQPPRPAAPAVPHPTQFAGKSVADKLAELSSSLEETGADDAVLTLPDSIAWAFNIRGHDIPHTPVALAFAILPREGRPTLFIAPEKADEALRDHLAQTVDIAAPEAFEPALRTLGEAGRRVLVDPACAPEKIRTLLADAGAEIVAAQDPCILPKARKNAVEIEGSRMAHRRDGAAMARFLAWLDREAPLGHVDEISAAETLEALRAETGVLEDISFDTISASGPHAALPHYRVSRASNRPLAPGEIYLVDSGAQYRDGTTDITRTIVVGEPTVEMRDRFTTVLKGHIAIARIRFPARTTGAQIDILARMALWQKGLDFDHGTGHGVGSFLSVHEGPARISKAGHVAMEPGMILSNEPGYYAEDRYGIRIENLILVTEAEPVEGGERPMHGFETLSFTPIDRRLVEPAILDDGELAWLNAYHAEVRRNIAPLLEGEDLAWLTAATEPISR